MRHELYDFNGDVYIYRNNKYVKQRQTTLDEFPHKHCFNCFYEKQDPDNLPCYICVKRREWKPKPRDLSHV